MEDKIYVGGLIVVIINPSRLNFSLPYAFPTCISAYNAHLETDKIKVASIIQVLLIKRYKS